MKNKLLRRLFFFVLLTGFIGSVFAQQVRVTGTVTDAADGSSIPGVNIVEKGTTNGTISDLDGNYAITVGSNATLVFSFVGYVTQEIPVGGQGIIDIRLETDVMALEEVVSIGYGTTRKKDATGSVATVTSDDFNQGAISTPLELVQGKVAGVQITSAGGAPGEGVAIRIRGGSSLSASNVPLFVIDGVPVDNDGIAGMRSPLSSIHPSDIETFTVLKDASATAIYGNRASNGVVIITTKKGKVGRPLTINYNGNVSISSPTKMVDNFSSEEFRNLILDRNEGDASITDLLGEANTNWQDEIYKTAVSTDHNLSLTGSVSILPYRFSVGYSNQNGILKGDNFSRFTGALSLNPSLLDDHLSVDLNVKGVYAKNVFANRGAIGAAVVMDPTQPVYDEDSPYGGFFTWTNPDGTPLFVATTNPVAQLELRDDRATVNRIIGNVQFDYKLHFLPDLTAKLNLGLDRSSSDGTVDVPEYASWAFNDGGEKTVYDQKKSNELLDLYFDYAKDLGSINSRIQAMVGYSWQHFYREGSNLRTNVAGDRTFDESDYKTESYLISFFGRFNYVFMERYLLTFTLRQDGSSRFSPDNRWGLFPSVALAWDIGDEGFMDPDLFSNLKLRLGWGVTGQQNITDNDYPYLPRYTRSEGTAQYQYGNSYIRTFRPEGYDANLKWEETTTYNIGLDYGFLNNRITGDLDFYIRKTDDLINTIPVPAGTNLTNQILTNVGDLENRGFEFSINAKAISKPDLVWDIGFNLTRNKSEIKKLRKIDDPTYPGVQVGGISGAVGNTIQIHSVGYPAYSFYVLEQVYNTYTGGPIEGLYVDQNLDGQINDADRIRYKSPAPDVFMGFSTMIRYRNFDFGFSGRISIGNYVFNNNFSANASYQYIAQSGYLANTNRNVLDSGFENVQYFSDYYLENGSFLRMDNMTMGYNFESLAGSKARLRLYATGQNLFIITKYRGLDPEVFNGIDNNIYPRPRIFMLGVSLTY
jgi:iron complex outermembrane receptor protein